MIFLLAITPGLFTFMILPEDLRGYLADMTRKAHSVKTLYQEFEIETKADAKRRTISSAKGSIRLSKPDKMLFRLRKGEATQTEYLNGETYASFDLESKTAYITSPINWIAVRKCNSILIFFRSLPIYFYTSYDTIPVFLTSRFHAFSYSFRYNLKLLKVDQYYFYLEAERKMERGSEKAIIAVYQRGHELSYLPRQIEIHHNHGAGTQQVNLSAIIISPTNLKDADFVIPTPPSDWRIIKR